MGWDSFDDWRKKSDVINDQTRAGRFGEGSHVIASRAVRNGLWAVWEQGPKRFIAFELIERRKERGAARYWVKSLSEIEFPYYFDCPLKFLELAPAESAEWRLRVQAHWSLKATSKRAAQFERSA